MENDEIRQERKDTMREGFYYYRYNVYYGCYNEEQISGKVSVAIVKPEKIKTDHPIHKNDWAVTFWDNHSLLLPEYTDLQTMLLKMSSFMDLTMDGEVDFSAVEKKLNIILPKELKKIYSAISGRDEYFTSAERFLLPDEIYVEDGIIVFFKKKQTPIAGYDIKSGCLARYCKKEWVIEHDDMCCYQFCLGRMLTIALENKPVVKKGRFRGKFVTTLNIEKELEKFCDGKYHLLSEFNVYGIAVMYSDDGLIAWIRSNGFYADIHAGAANEADLESLSKHLVDMAWK